MRSVPVIMYHHVLPSAGYIASSIEQFEAQMRYLARAGYKTLSSEEFVAFKRGEYQPPKRAVLITFDDGWRDNYVHALPILRRYGLRATLFVITEWVERASAMEAEFAPLQHNDAHRALESCPRSVVLNWQELEEMKECFDIHSHTHTHREGREIPWGEDLAQARELLQERLGIISPHLCWPRGKYTQESMKIAQEMGYEILYTTQRGVNLPDKVSDEIKRMAVKGGAFWLAKNLWIFSQPRLGAWYAGAKR